MKKSKRYSKMKVVRNDNLEATNGESIGKLNTSKKGNDGKVLYLGTYKSAIDVSKKVYRNIDICKDCEYFGERSGVVTRRTQANQEEDVGMYYTCEEDGVKCFEMTKVMFEMQDAPKKCPLADRLRESPPWEGKITMKFDVCKHCDNFFKSKSGGERVYSCNTVDGCHITTKEEFEKQTISKNCLMKAEYLLNEWNNKE